LRLTKLSGSPVMEAHGNNIFMARKRGDENDFLNFKRKFIEAWKTRTEAKKKKTKTKQPRRALKIQSLPSASGKWITNVRYD